VTARRASRGRLALGLVTLLAAALAAPARATAGPPWLPPLLTIDADSLQRLVAEGRPVVAVDLRPAEAYRDGRLPGARSMPLAGLAARQRELPADAIVVLYGATGVDEAASASRYLRGAGHRNVFVLEGGFAAWRAQGHGVER
jgi:rhodanese-related sulfurtransferase